MHDKKNKGSTLYMKLAKSEPQEGHYICKKGYFARKRNLPGFCQLKKNKSIDLETQDVSEGNGYSGSLLLLSMACGIGSGVLGTYYATRRGEVENSK